MKFATPFTVAVIAASVAGCAATYQAPTTTAIDTTFTIDGTQANLLRATKQALVAEGYQITAADDRAGVISTAPREARLTPALADCGTTMGLDYLLDARTFSKVAIGAIVTHNRVTLKSTIVATYLPGSVSQSIQMNCVSRGGIENALFERIAAAGK